MSDSGDNSDAVRWDFAMQLIERSEFARASEQLQNLLELYPESEQAMSMLGFCEVAEGRPEPGLELCRRAVALGPEDSMTHYMFALALLVTDQVDAAEASLLTAIELDPQDSSNFELKAKIKLTRHDWQGALDASNEAISLDPSSARAHSLRSVALRLLQDNGQAFQSVTSALELEPDDAESHASLGWIHLENNRIADAQEAFSSALSINPRSEYALKGLVETQKSKNLLLLYWRKVVLWLGLGSESVKSMTGCLWIGAAVCFGLLASIGLGIPPLLRYSLIPLYFFISSLSVVVFYGPITMALVARNSQVRPILSKSSIWLGLILIVGHFLLATITLAALFFGETWMVGVSIAIAVLLEVFAVGKMTLRKSNPWLVAATCLPCLGIALFGCLVLCIGEDMTSRVTGLITTDVEKWTNRMPWTPLAMFWGACLWITRSRDTQSQPKAQIQP